jgi:hypothetical protein
MESILRRMAADSCRGLSREEVIARSREASAQVMASCCDEHKAAAQAECEQYEKDLLADLFPSVRDNPSFEKAKKALEGKGYEHAVASAKTASAIMCAIKGNTPEAKEMCARFEKELLSELFPKHGA